METLYTLQQRNIAQSQTLQAGSGRPVTPLDAARANDIFDHFLNASTLKSILGHYRLICDLLHLRPSTLPNFYPKLKQHLTSWRAKAVWKKFDARANNKVYGKGRVCPETRVLIIGAGPCGLRTAIEAQMLGAKVVVLEKRDRMSRNNVLHLWPFVIDDLRSLGAKKFFGKFCAGSIDHISIRQLQCILLKVALLLGIEIHTEVSYESLVEPSIENKRGWRAQVKPTDHPVSQYEFDVIIGADGKRNTLQGFKRKEFRGKLAIAITANFINRRTEAEARVEEISGVAFIFNQKFFKDLYAETQIDLENIVYYKDDTHYFVMTAKKHSLLSKSVIRSDQTDTARLLSPDNVDRTALMAYAREAAEFSTGRQMLDLEFAVNHYGQPDVAMFDFTSMYAAENASRIVDREGYRLLCILVGDSLLEPFWPTGSGCARGFLSSLDAAWAIRAWGSAVPPLSVLAERESIYRLLGGTTPENLHRDSKSYSLDPSSRYPKLNRQVLSSHQVIGLYDTDDVAALKAQTQKEEEVVEVQHQHGSGVIKETAKKRRKIDEEDLLSWIKKQVVDYNLPVPNLSENTFNDGKILCAILHHYRPDLVDYKDLPEDNALCCHIAIELLEKEIGISSIIAPSEMATMECTRQQLISYLSQIYETFKREIAHINHPKMDMPELKQHTLNALTGATNTTIVPTESPMHHRNFAGLRATPPHHHQLTQTKPNHHHYNHHHIRQAIPLAVTGNNVSASGGGVGAASTVAGSSVATGRSRKRKSAAPAGGGGAGRGDADGVGLDHPPAQWQQKNERDEDIAARMRQIEDRWYETTAQEANAVAQRNMSGAPKKPKDLMRAIGKIETSDWNIREIEKKIKENRSGGGGGKGGKERVPKWSREQFQARQAKMERKHLLDRQDSTNGKYSELDKNLKLLDQRLKEGTIRDLNQHKIAKIAEKLKPKEQVDNQKEKSPKDIKPSPSVVLPSANSSEYCHFCAKRVYLMEKLNAENRCFHRNCFRCEYCHTLLRPGAYKYDTDGKYGHRFYCIHHYGFSGQLPALVSARNRGAPSTRAQKDTGLVTPTNQPGIICDSLLTSTPNNKKSVEGTLADIAPTREVVEGGAPLGILGRVTGVDLLDRVQTPERIEFSNLSTGNASSDHEEPPSIMDEDEWTDRNFGASTAEVCSSDDDDSYSDSDSEEEYEEAVEEPATKEGNLRILERYSRFSRKHDSDSAEYSSSEQSSYCENTSGDEESDTATEGEEEIRARELRKQEVRLEPPIITDTGTDTEINSDDTVYSKSNEAPNSATEISTDSEFAQDEPTPTREIPAIIFNDAFVTKTRGSGHVARVHVTSGDLRKHNNAPPPPPPQKPTAQQNHNSHTPTPKKPTNLPLLNRLTDGFPLNRTQSTSGIAAMRSLELKKRYLLGESNCSVATNAAIQKSGSASTLDSKLKSFHSNITDCQRMLKPAQEGAVRSVFSGDNVAAIGGAAVDFKANETAVLVLAKNGEHQTPPLSFTITTQNTSNQPCPSLETTQSKPVKNVPATEQSYQNELEGRPRSPAHETSIIVPTIDWPRRNKPEKGFSDRTSSESDAEVAAERSANITETVEDKQIDIEPLDSLNYMPLVTDAAPKSICSEKKALNQPKTLPGLFGRPETASGRSTPTQGGGNDSCITGCLTETELSDWARDGAVSDDFDYEYEHALTSRKNNEPKKLGNFNSTIESNNKLGFDDKLTSLNALDGKSMHVCGRSDDIVECVNSILNPNLKNIDYMDTGSENSSCSDDDVKKNNGYVQFYNENDMADDSLSPVINNLSKLTVLEVKNPLMTATIEDFDELSTPTKNTGFCEVVGATPMPSSNCNFGGTVVDLKPTDLEQLKRKQTLVQNEMDSLQVAADTGTEDNTCSDSTVKNVDDFKPTYDNNNVSVDKKRLEDKLMQVKQDMFTKKSIKDDCELYAAHCQRLQSKLEFTNVRDSIDVRKNAQKNQPILAPSPKPDLIQQDEPQVQFRLTLTPTNLYQKEIIAKERDLNQRLIHEMILHKYKSENKSLERKKRPRNSSFSPCGANTFELSKSATTADLTANNVTPPDVILSTTNTAALKELQKSQTMAEIKITPSNRNVTSTSDKPMVPVLSQQMVPQQVYTCYQIDRTPSYDKMRQEARAKAKLLSDTALGLSPEDKLLRLRERIRGHDNTADAATSQRTPVHRTNSHVALRDTKSGLVVNRNSIAESHFNSAPVDGAAIYAHDTLNSERRNKSFRRPGVADKAPELTGSRSVQNIQRGGFSGGASFKSDSNLLLDKSLGELGGCGNSGEKKVAKDRERRKSITRVISDFFGSIRKDKNSNLSAARGFLARISPKARERSKSCINLPRENLVKETISLRKSASSDLNFSPHSSARDTSPPPVPPLPDNYGTKLEDSSDAELDFQRQYSLDNIDPALPVDNTSIGHATGSRRNSRGTAKRSARQAQLKRHRTAQEIQRKLEETEVKIRDLELAGVAIEKRLGSGEPETTCSGGVGDAKRYAECGGGRGRPVPNDVLSEWFGVMRELTEWRRYERELVTRAEELQLEDRHARLQNKLRDKLTCDTTEGEGGVRGTSTDAGVILEEMMDIVAKRDCIIANLEQDKQRYTDEDTEFEEQMLAKGMKLIPTFKKSVESN